MSFKSTIIGLTLLSAYASNALAEDIIRHPIPNSDFPILQAVEVPADKTMVYLSGTVPSVINEEADQNSVEAFGTTEEQTVTVMKRIEAQLESLGLGVGDIIKMQAFLVAPEGASVDFQGFMAGYTQFFGTEEQSNLPVRSAMVVDALVNPGWLVEIEVTAVRP
ncbi:MULTISPECIES: RidA family protein [unclassified Halomonas]|uniref:RidA family protein n=1 Tax=unclassified Halomonas TaxID=2609666 RepID=UPI001969E3D8|nr:MULTISPECIES: RidA family protein [unclassified Halomonas]MBT2787060.1 RidA family protein [Halomonas sp. ISL-106]MBT2795402.1 RidA family protein [Halomonas sp. ISL-104]